MKILSSVISVEELKGIAENGFGDMVKAVVDIERELVAVDAELHSDLEALLLENGSQQTHLWGINFYPDILDDDFIEFDCLINIRPSSGNKSRGVDSIEIQNKIRAAVGKWVDK